MHTALLRAGGGWGMIQRMSASAPVPSPSPRSLLAEQVLFRGLPEAEMAQLWDTVRHREVAPGRCVYRAGESAEALYLVVEGSLEVVKRETGESGLADEQVIGWVTVGDLFGETALLAGRRHTSEVRATEPSVLVEVPRRTLDALFERHPSRRLRLRTLSVTRRLASVSAAFKGDRD